MYTGGPVTVEVTATCTVEVDRSVAAAAAAYDARGMVELPAMISAPPVLSVAKLRTSAVEPELRVMGEEIAKVCVPITTIGATVEVTAGA